MTKLFTPLSLRGLVIPNRLWMSPMCQYSASEGLPNDWHKVHLGTRAVGGTGLIITEATAVEAVGRISPEDTGLWNDEQQVKWADIVSFVKDQGARIGIQLGHAGRKASTFSPWRGNGSVDTNAGGWPTIGPSAVAFGDYSQPAEMDTSDLARVRDAFVASAQRAVEAGFEVIELHGAHGYLLHQFLSPLSNERSDAYGGSLENRMRFPLEVAAAVRAVMPDEMPLFVRISATDWVEDGWDIESSIHLAMKLKSLGADLIDVSTGGLVHDAVIPTGPGYQVDAARQVRTGAGLAVAAVGLITEAEQAAEIVSGDIDAVFLGRKLLRDPYFPITAAKHLGIDREWPSQYARAKS